MTNVAILVPIRRDGGWRDKLWEYCQARWRAEFPDWPVFEGLHEAHEGPFNRSAAINRAAAQADAWFGRPWEVALIIDGDTISEPWAVRAAVERARETGQLSIAHNARHMLARPVTHQIVLNGLELSRVKLTKANVKKTWYDSISCAVAVRRDVWDAVGGFDEQFVGWGFEDTAFRIAVETLTDKPIHVEQAACLHLWHESSPEASKYAPTFTRNNARKLRYERAHYQPERLRAILEGRPDPGLNLGSIPRILHRTVPLETDAQVEAWWDLFAAMHPDWDLRTWREPLDPADFPRTGHLFDRCANGAQKAGLVRLELLATYGGVYVDSDVEPVRPLDALTHLPAFAGWEDERVVPDAVLGAAPGHPAIKECLARAIALIEGGSQDAWETGPGVTTAVLPWRDDVLLLPPGSFYPVHYLEKAALGSRNEQPWVFLEHKWHHSWGTPAQLERNARRQRIKVQDEQTESSGLEEIPRVAPDGAVVCIPWRDNGDARRRKAFDWCHEWWCAHGFEVILGEGDSRARMCNDAAAKAIARGFDTLVIADADTWAPGEQVVKAITQARETEGVVHAYTEYARLDASLTGQWQKVDKRRARLRVDRIARAGRRTTRHVSGLLTVTGDAWRRLGGFDERFVKWGFEDQVFHLAAETLVGVSRVDGYAVHWYHREDPTRREAPDPDLVDLVQSYCQAAGRIPSYGRVGRLASQGTISITSSTPNAEQMQAVLSGVGGPLSSPDVVG